jgi:hypothetical protein
MRLCSAYLAPTSSVRSLLSDLLLWMAGGWWLDWSVDGVSKKEGAPNIFGGKRKK